MNRFTTRGLALLIALVATLAAAPMPTSAAPVNLGANVAARFDLTFKAVYGSKVSGNGVVEVTADSDLGLLDEGIDLGLAVDAEASVNLKGLQSNTRYTVVIAGAAVDGSNISGACSIATEGGKRGALVNGSCSATVAALASVGGVEVRAGGASGKVVARANVSASVGAGIGLGLG